MTAWSWAQRAGVGVLFAGVLAGTASCGTDYEGTEERAAESARASARAVEESLAGVVVSGEEAPIGEALLQAVREQIPDSSGRIVLFDLAAISDDEVSVKVAFDGLAESGGGGTYYRFLARLCVEYRVRGGDAHRVTTADTRCSPELLEPTGPTQKADRTIGLED
jgi:hypothetical protein